MCMGLADLITDAVTYTRLRDGAIPVSNEGAKAAYVAILCFGAATTAVALAYRLHNVRSVRAHLHEFGRQGPKVTDSEARQQAHQHDWEMAQTQRTKVVLLLELLSVAAQGAGCTVSGVGWMCGLHAAPVLRAWMPLHCRFAYVQPQHLSHLRRQRSRPNGVNVRH
jgi:hypothetical protein